MWPEDNVMPLSTQMAAENLPNSIDEVRGCKGNVVSAIFRTGECTPLVKQILISPFSFVISPLSEWKGK